MQVNEVDELPQCITDVLLPPHRTALLCARQRVGATNFTILMLQFLR